MKSAVDESCLDIYTAKLNSRLATFGCHQQGRNQFFGFVKNGQIVTAEELCVGTPHIEMSSSSMPVVLVECSEHDLFQFWKYDSKVIKSLNFDLGKKFNMFNFYRKCGFHKHKLASV